MNERQTRPLTPLPDDAQPEAWKQAVEEAKARGKAQPTHEDVKRGVSGTR